MVHHVATFMCTYGLPYASLLLAPTQPKQLLTLKPAANRTLLCCMRQWLHCNQVLPSTPLRSAPHHATLPYSPSNYSLLSTLYPLPSTLHSLLSTLYSTPLHFTPLRSTPRQIRPGHATRGDTTILSLYSLLSTLYSLLSTLYPLPSTLYPLPSTLYPLHSTLYSTLYSARF